MFDSFFGVPVGLVVAFRIARKASSWHTSLVPYAAHSRSTMPCMRDMWLLLEHMKEKRHSAGSCRSIRHPGRWGSNLANRASAFAHPTDKDARETERLK